MKSSHKARLFLISTATVGLTLAVLFLSIVLAVRQKVLAHKYAEMRLAVETAPSAPENGLDLDAFRRIYPGYTVAVFDDAGNVKSASGPLPIQPIFGFRNHGSYVQFGMSLGGEHVVVSSGWTQAEHGLDDLATVLGVLWLPLTLLVGVATWLGASSVFKPLERLSQQAAAISGSNLKERLATQDRAEFGAFATQLNKMLDRIEQTVAREEQFASDAAHELRTPLAILRTRVETVLLKERTPGEYSASYGAQLAELERLTLIVESLLRSARASLPTVEAIDVEPVIGETVSRYRDRFAEKGVDLDVHAEPVQAKILAEEIEIVLSNLLDNALRFSPPGKRVHLSLRSLIDGGELIVEDGGPGIPEQLASRAFERFFRADDSRNRASGGAGIGLAVCKRILESRGGTIELAPSKKGAKFVCRIYG